MRAKKILFTIIIFVITITNILSQTTTIKTSTFKYKSTKETELVLNNSYGNINIINSKNDSILIEVRVSKKTRNKKISKRLLNKININENIDDKFITISTILNDKKNRDNLHIDYIVYVPIRTNMFIANKHGNVYIGDHKGKLNISINYGKFEAKNLISSETTPLSKLNFKFCDVNIDNCNWLEINSLHTNFNIISSKSLVINSNYSVVKLEKNAILKLISNNDIYKVNSISKIFGTTKNTSFYAKNVTTAINIVGENGYFKTGYISNYFDKVNIKYTNGDVSLLIDDKTSYKLNCIVRSGNLSIDKDTKITKGSSFNSIKGLIGADKGTKKTVDVKVLNGDLEF